jgi:hypothetical protein
MDSRKTTSGGINTLPEFENGHYLIKAGRIGSKATRVDKEKMPSRNSTRPNHGNITVINLVG